MKKDKNSFWEFFASVKLALFCFFTLAIASIVGTIIPQNESPDFYIQKYGETTAEIFRLLNIPDMYNSWWFVSILSLFSINLIVCSIDRLPTVWKLVTMDNLATKVNRLEKMTPRNRFASAKPLQEVAAEVEQTLKGAGWKPSQRETEGGTLLVCPENTLGQVWGLYRALEHSCDICRSNYRHPFRCQGLHYDSGE